MLKDLCMKTFKTLMKEMFKTDKRNIFHIYWLEELILLIHPFYPELSTYSLQSLWKFQNFSQNKQKNSTTCIKLLLLLLLFSCQSCLTLTDVIDCSAPDFPVAYPLLEFAQVHALWIGDAIQPILIICQPLFLLPSVFPSIRVFSNESAIHIRWPMYWSFSISPSKEYMGLIFFKVDWFWAPSCPRDSQESSTAP